MEGEPVNGGEEMRAGWGPGVGVDAESRTSAEPGDGTDSVLDLVLDLVPGEAKDSTFGAASASVSVPASDPVPAVEVKPVWPSDPVGAEPVPYTVPDASLAAAPGPAPADLVSVGAEAGAVPAAEVKPAWPSDPVGAEPVPYTVPDLSPAALPDPASAALLDAASAALLDAVPGPAPTDLVSLGVEAGAVPASVSALAPDPVPAAEVKPAWPSDPITAEPVPYTVPDTVSDALLDAAPGPAPAALPSVGAEGDGADGGGDARWETGRQQALSDNGRTAVVPVHVHFRDDPARADAFEPPADSAWQDGGGEKATGVRRAPVARRGQVQAPTQSAPAADPYLTEKPGPALPGWIAVLTGLAGVVAGGAVLWWVGALPRGVLARAGIGARPYDGIGLGTWAVLVLLAALVLFALGGLGRGRVGHAWVLTLFGDYRGSVRRTGLVWISPLLLRRRVDVRLRHWRSEPLPAVDANGTALRVVVLVVWRIKDTVRATFGVADHEEYLREQVESAMARVLSQLPADAFHEDAYTLRNGEAVGDALTLTLKADCEPVGIEVYSAQPTGIDYAPEVAASMQRRRIAAIDAQHRDSVLTSVVDAVDDTVSRLTARGLVTLDDYERKALVKDLTVAFYTGRTGGEGS
ncbi:SPFH domain-containing protein [Streptomyces sp. NPDC005318]|uniref:SPFH domain-containing protein n=1 Tax=Streptomyces sp. NPDC005318 TaxID=3157031 RepID=UPI0033B62567